MSEDLEDFSKVLSVPIFGKQGVLCETLKVETEAILPVFYTTSCNINYTELSF